MSKKTGNIVSKRLVRSYVTSVISISLVLMLVAAVSIFVANAGGIARYFKENMTVSVMVKQSASEKEARDLCARLEGKESVKDARFVTKEEGAAEMKALLGEDFLDIFETSPIPFSIELHLDGDVVTKDSLNFIKEMILLNPQVDEVVYQESLVEALNANLKKISVVLAVVIVLLLVISSALIGNTVRLNIYARRFTIHTMSLVGAQRSFIARPFVRQGIVQGAVAGAIAVAAILAMLFYIKDTSPLLASILSPQTTATVLAGTVLMGIALCVIATIFVVCRVAYISKDDLYY